VFIQLRTRGRTLAGTPCGKREARAFILGLSVLTQKLIKIGAKLVSHGRYVAFQMAEVAIPRSLFAEILQLIGELRPPPDPASA